MKETLGKEKRIGRGRGGLFDDRKFVINLDVVYWQEVLSELGKVERVRRKRGLSRTLET